MAEEQPAKSIFSQAVELPEQEREAYVAQACAGDEALLARVRGLLRAHGRGEDFMGSPTATTAAVRPSAPSEGPGSRIGPYKLLQLIGEGGFGSVFMAEQERPVARRVALKIIKLGMDTRQVIARFEAERQALAMMDHPNIARVFDAGATETGRPFFVMELVRGEPITEYCDRNSLGLQERLELFELVCGAVQHAHQKGIIHRDIKPSNVLVTSADSRPIPKIIDFGIAKSLAARLTEKTLFTEHRQLIGTPEYMSPEQAEMTSSDIDTRSDIYSLGVLLYELLTGVTPFDGKRLRSAGYGEIQRIIREVEPPRPSTRLSTMGDSLPSIAAHRKTEPRKLGALVRGDLDWIVMKALEKDRTRRYETANGLAMDVQRHICGEAVTAAPPSRAYRIQKFVRRNKGPVAAASLLSAALVLGLAGTLWQGHVAAGERDTARRQAKRADDEAAAERQRAEELKKVSEFQESMLQQVDPIRAGVLLTRDVNHKFEASLEQDKVPDAERPAQTAAFSAQWRHVNATDAARDLIDATILKPSIEAIDKQFKDQPAVDAKLRQVLAERYRKLGLFDAATPLQQSALETRRRVLGEDHPDTIVSVRNTGSLLMAAGKLDQAEPYLRQAMDKARRVMGEEDPETITCIYELGALLREQGKRAEAEPLLREALDRRRRVLGSDNPATLDAIDALARLFQDQGKYDQAEPLLREAMQTWRRNFGEDHPDTLGATNNLAAVLFLMGKRAEAEPYFRDLTDRYRRVLGEEHPETLTSISNMGFVLEAQGKYDQAERYLSESLEKHRRVLGEEHPGTIAVINHVGRLLRGEGKYADAEPYFREALEISRRVLGQEHQTTLNNIHDMGIILQDEGKPEQAEPYFREALEKSRRVLGEDHPETLGRINSMGSILQSEGKLAEAERLYREALEKQRRVLGEDHPYTINTITNMGAVLVAQDKLADAEPYYRDALEKRRRVLGDEHPSTLISMGNLGFLLQIRGNFFEAEPLLRDGLEKSRRLLGPDHPGTMSATNLMGGLLDAQGKYSDALQLLAPLEPAARKAYTGSNGWRLARLLMNLGRARAGLAKEPTDFAAAEANLLEAQLLLLKTRGEKHRDYRECTQALVDFYAAWDKAEPGKGHDAKAAEWQAKLGP